MQQCALKVRSYYWPAVKSKPNSKTLGLADWWCLVLLPLAIFLKMFQTEIQVYTMWNIQYFYFLQSIHRHNQHSLIHGLLNRWTDIFILPRTAWGGPFDPYNITQTHSIFVKLLKNTFLGMPTVRVLSIFTLPIP